MTGRLAGRRALVTGSTRGIGRAVARALAGEGATVVVSGRDDALGAEVVAELERAGGRCAFVGADLSSGTPAVQRLAQDAAVAAEGPIDVLVNNAGALVRAQSLLEATEEQIDRVLALNVKAPFLLTAALAPAMIEAGGGAIVNIGSTSGVVGMAQAALYSASKAALHSLTESFATELGPRGVRVNTVAPGPTLTERTERHTDVLERLTRKSPAGRPATAEEVAAAVVFLASDEAAHIHGATLPVEGGALIQR
jgi:NAD(P)-dependent dehydrogenase (short-subunit alcohol dehydrogenase family)